MALNSRKRRKEMRQRDMRASRIENGHKKRSQHIRQDAVMKDLIKQSNLPYTPPILSWLSVKLNKPGRLITADDVKKIVG